MKIAIWKWVIYLSIFFAPIYAAIASVIFLVLADTFTGVYAAYKQNEKITSRKLGNIITKILLYNLALISSHVAMVNLIPLIPLVQLCSGTIAIIEIKSIFENINKATKIDFWASVKLFLNRKKE